MSVGSLSSIEVERLGGLIWATVRYDEASDGSIDGPREVLSFRSERVLGSWLTTLLCSRREMVQVVIYADDPSIERAVDEARQDALASRGAAWDWE